MEPFELTVMRQVAKTVAQWRWTWGDEAARQLTADHVIVMLCVPEPEFHDAYATAFGR